MFDTISIISVITKGSVNLTEYIGAELGFNLDKEANTLALVFRYQIYVSTIYLPNIYSISTKYLHNIYNIYACCCAGTRLTSWHSMTGRRSSNGR